MATVTNRRLVVTYKNAEESFPLSKINAVRIVFNRSIKMMIVGGIAALAGLGAISNSVLAGLVLIAIGAALLYFGWIGKTKIAIGQPGGDKYYNASGVSTQLKDFVEVVNGRLS